jgi:glycine cleavage system regulatory protein
MHHVRGALGEWTAAFELGKGGVFIFLKGPKAEVTTAGTDLIAIDRNTGEVYVIDNKATLRTKILQKVTALMRNFPQNLAQDIRELRAAAGEHMEPAIAAVLARMEKAEARIREVVELLGPEGEARKKALDANVEVTLRSGERVPVQQEITDILQVHGIKRIITTSGGVLERISNALDEAGIEIERMDEGASSGTE